jgi:hypothetical protein
MIPAEAARGVDMTSRMEPRSVVPDAVTFPMSLQRHTNHRVGRADFSIPTSRRPCAQPVNLFMLCRFLYYRVNTNSIEAGALFLSSGRLPMTKGDCLEPASTAIYCFPSTE